MIVLDAQRPSTGYFKPQPDSGHTATIEVI